MTTSLCQDRVSRNPLLRWSLEDLKNLNAFILQTNQPGFRDRNVATHNALGSKCLHLDHAEVEETMEFVWSHFQTSLRQVKSFEDLAAALGFFWDAFILKVHPFLDGNGRTAKAAINIALNSLGLEIRDFHYIERAPVSDDSEESNRKLRNYYFKSFLVSIKAKTTVSLSTNI